MPGYPDYQRLSNWDAAPVVADKEVTLSEGQEKGPFNVSRYASLAGVIQVFTQAVAIGLAWTAEGGVLGGFVGRMEFVVNPGITGLCQFMIPNLGPLVTIQTKPPVGKPTKWTANIFPTVRTSLIPFIPGRPVLMHTSLALAKAVAKIISPLTYFAGPMTVQVENETTGELIIRLESEVEPEVSVIVDRWSVATGQSLSKQVIAPPGAWVIVVVSLGEGNISIAATASTTGSS